MEDDLKKIKKSTKINPIGCDTIVNLPSMEDIFENGRRPQFFLKEDNLFFLKMEDDLKQNIMQPKTFKSKNNNMFVNGRRPQYILIIEKTTSKNIM
jgi:hypothetical protein